MQESWQYKTFKVCNAIILLGIVFVTLFPFINVVAKSFSSQAFINSGQVSFWPKGFNINTYKLIMSDSMFWVNYKNTFI